MRNILQDLEDSSARLTRFVKAMPSYGETEPDPEEEFPIDSLRSVVVNLTQVVLAIAKKVGVEANDVGNGELPEGKPLLEKTMKAAALGRIPLEMVAQVNAHVEGGEPLPPLLKSALSRAL